MIVVIGSHMIAADDFSSAAAKWTLNITATELIFEARRKYYTYLDSLKFKCIEIRRRSNKTIKTRQSGPKFFSSKEMNQCIIAMCI